jgi:hypothetical protein
MGQELTPEARLAIVVENTFRRFRIIYGHPPDAADLRADLACHFLCEILFAELRGVQRTTGRADRVREILAELAELKFLDHCK